MLSKSLEFIAAQSVPESRPPGANGGNGTAQAAVVEESVALLDAYSQAVIRVANRVSPAVVGILATRELPVKVRRSAVRPSEVQA